MENELIEAAKELLNDFDMYGSPVQLRVIARLRRAVEAAQQGVQADLLPCGHSRDNLGGDFVGNSFCSVCRDGQ